MADFKEGTCSFGIAKIVKLSGSFSTKKCSKLCTKHLKKLENVSLLFDILCNLLKSYKRKILIVNALD